MALLAGGADVWAQATVPDERVKPTGEVSQKIALTSQQKNAIYNAMTLQHARGPERLAPALFVGAAVPSSIELSDLPDQTIASNPWATAFKFAFVENDVVVVDPIRMRVVEIIHAIGNP